MAKAAEDAGSGQDEDQPAVVRVDAEGLAHRVICCSCSARATTPPSPQQTGHCCGWTASSPASPGKAGPARRTARPRPAWSGSTWPSAVSRDDSWSRWTATGSPATAGRLSTSTTRRSGWSPAAAKADEESGQLVKCGPEPDQGAHGTPEASGARPSTKPGACSGTSSGPRTWQVRTGTRSTPATALSWTGSAPTTISWTCSGNCTASWARPTRTSVRCAVTENGSNGQGRLGADLSFHRAGLGDHPDPGGRVLGPAGHLTTDPPRGRTRKPATSCWRSTASSCPKRVTPAMQLVGAAGRAVELTLLQRCRARRRRPDGSAGSPSSRSRTRSGCATRNGSPATAGPSGKRRGGTFGYLHIPDMMANGWAQLHRDLDTETALDGLIVDVRRNRGGHTSQLVAELIGRKVTGWSMPRGEKPRTYPHHAPRGPGDHPERTSSPVPTATSSPRCRSCAASGRSSAPVPGAAWSGIDNRFSLADGTGVTQPRYATWFGGGVGWGVENYGVTRTSRSRSRRMPTPPGRIRSWNTASARSRK